MPLVSALRAQSGLQSVQERVSEARESRLQNAEEQDEFDGALEELTTEERDRYEIITYCNKQFDEYAKAREPFETFEIAWNLFIDNVWPKPWPPYRAKITINKIRAFITFMQAIMTDNKPRIAVDPLFPGSEDAADLLRKLCDRHWDNGRLQNKLSIFNLYGLIWGTGIMKCWYDPFADGGRGRHMDAPIPPYAIYTNRTASSVDDAEGIIHVDDQTMGWIRRNFPEKARNVQKVRGQYTTRKDGSGMRQDFIREGDATEKMTIISAQRITGGGVTNVTPPTLGGQTQRWDDDAEVEIREHWFKDDSLETYERQTIVNGQLQFEPVTNDDGEYEFETIGAKLAISEVDGAPFLAPVRRVKTKPVMEKAWRQKYPNGRLVIIAGGRVLLRDIPAPYQIDGFPFAQWKDYDVGNFWGQGETIALKNCQIALNRIVSQLYDILEKIGNPSYKLKKGAGVNAQQIKSKPGLIIPMDEMDGLQPLDKPTIPAQFIELFQLLRGGMGEISGVTDAVQGIMPAPNTAFATIDSLQESSAAPIRLKVRNFEEGIARIGKLRIQLIQQFDNGSTPLRETVSAYAGDTTEGVVTPAPVSETRFRSYSRADLQGQVEFSIVPISSLSTSPASAWNKWMMMYDKHLIDRRWWHSRQRVEGWKTELPRIEKAEQLEQVQGAALKSAAKSPGPAPKTPSAKARRGRTAPKSYVPSRADHGAVR